MVYPYRTIKSGKFTKWIVYITDKRTILVQRYFKGLMRSQNEFKTKNNIEGADIPKNIKAVALNALYESVGLF